MSHSQSVQATAGPALYFPESGFASQIVEYTWGAVTGSMSLHVCNLPSGARVTNAKILQTNNAFGSTANETVALFTTIGGTKTAALINTVTGALHLAAGATDNGYGIRHTSSAIVFAHLQAGAVPSTTSFTQRYIVQYDCRLRGD